MDAKNPPLLNPVKWTVQSQGSQKKCKYQAVLRQLKETGWSDTSHHRTGTRLYPRPASKHHLTAGMVHHSLDKPSIVELLLLCRYKILPCASI
jgi:hypothetical protein